MMQYVACIVLEGLKNLHTTWIPLHLFYRFRTFCWVFYEQTGMFWPILGRFKLGTFLIFTGSLKYRPFDLLPINQDKNTQSTKCINTERRCISTEKQN